MATQIIMPQQGNTVESCVILEWKKAEGDTVEKGDVLCEVETDKATFEVEAEAGGTLLKIFFDEGEDVPVLTPIAVVGEEGEDISNLAPQMEQAETPAAPAAPEGQEAEAQREPGPAEAAGPSQEGPAEQERPPAPEGKPADGKVAISPRARLLAESEGIDYTTVGGSGPGGRIIERDIRYVLGSRAPITPAAIEAMLESGKKAPRTGTGIGGRVTREDLEAAEAGAGVAGAGTGAGAAAGAGARTGAGAAAGAGAGAAGAAAAAFPGPTTEHPVKGVRKRIADRMYSSLQSTAQLTLNSSAEVSNMLAYRKKLKASAGEYGLQDVTVNDIVLYVVSRILPRFSEVNAHFLEDKIVEFHNVHLGFAVDTFKGLMVPVIRNANHLSLKEISDEAKRLSTRCSEGTIEADELSGGTFTVTNLGVLGIESFTPVLNAPEVGILGVCAIQLKPVMQDDEVEHLPHMGLSLTFNHQAVDGAPAARFLKQISHALSNFDLFLAW
jgi:pyruvate dehydrogenase E2 component (dihydrolipoamide acetyltransferase)